MSSFSERLFRILKRHPSFKNKGMLAEHLGCSRSMLYNYEQGNPDPPREILDKIAALEVVIGINRSSFDESATSPAWSLPSSPSLAPRRAGDPRRIPVVGWAHAGHAASYDELPKDWQETIPTDCRDERAFGVRLEGDSMEPSYREGDMLVLMPSEEIYSGCFAVCRFVDDGVVFRRIEFIGDRIQLVAINERYQVTQHSRSDFAWIYPVWGRWSQLWK